MQTREPVVVSNQSQNDHFWAAMCHLSALLGYVIPVIGHLIGPLAVWMAKRQQSIFIDQQGKEALNFQISVAIYYLISFCLIIFVVGIFLVWLVAALNLIFIIIATVSSYKGEAFRYPLCIRFIK